ncbi:type A2 lanthipeptide [Neobacillus cucumis]|nr:type A2 lanthipeptide [Neobacillus cucumis]MBM7652797.1 bacteriocin-like protein [Neobacillus cucumis]MED4229355.1 type A2 lanthipeptide [Neobacillus cucumis]
MSKLNQEELQLLVPTMSDKELEQVAGGMPCGYFCTITLDCDWSTFGCGC